MCTLKIDCSIYLPKRFIIYYLLKTDRYVSIKNQNSSKNISIQLLLQIKLYLTIILRKNNYNFFQKFKNTKKVLKNKSLKQNVFFYKKV